LHVCAEFDELEIARWLLERGMDPDVPAEVDERGFGGHTALFGAVVSYPNFWMNYTGGWAHSRKPKEARFAELLLDRGADPNARATLPEPASGTVRAHRSVTPLAWGEAFQNKIVVSEPAMRLIAERGGHR
jgi:ankyrin repeat protein